MNICLDAEMKKMGFRSMLPWKSVAMTLQEGRKPEGQRVVPGPMENTKGKKIWVDILISQEVERREIHYCFSSAVTMCKTKTQLRPVGQISRGKCCLLPVSLKKQMEKTWPWLCSWSLWSASLPPCRAVTFREAEWDAAPSGCYCQLVSCLRLWMLLFAHRFEA